MPAVERLECRDLVGGGAVDEDFELKLLRRSVRSIGLYQRGNQYRQCQEPSRIHGAATTGATALIGPSLPWPEIETEPLVANLRPLAGAAHRMVDWPSA